MTARRPILLFWILLLVPALILGGVALRMLILEQERSRRSYETTLTEQAYAIAESIELALVGVQDNLTRALLDLAPQNHPADLETRLLAWEKTNPLIRNVFVYHPDQGLLYPPRSMAATSEERQFTQRFDTFFSGQTRFDADNPASGTEPSRPKSIAEPSPSTARTSRQSLYELSRVGEPVQKRTFSVQADAEESMKTASGWIPWFSQNRLHLLGWVRLGTGPVYGVELELMTFLSRLITDFPQNRQPNTAMVLTDGTGAPLHRSGSGEIDAQAVPLARIGVSKHLPHWEISVFAHDDAFGSGTGFMVISLTLVGILMAAILFGGVMITRLTLSKIRDARLKTSFVASVSHELKTPLTSIRMYGELLQSGRIRDTAKQDRYLQVIVGESQRLTRLINNVLDFGKLEQGRKQYHPTRFDPARFLSDLVRDQSIRIQEKGLEAILEIPPGKYRVTTDRDALEQAILNLLDNALKYAGEGRFIRFTLEQTAGRDILIRICDDGPGIDAALSEKIFEKFYRVDDSLTATQPGSGFGLSIARQMLRDLGCDLYYTPARETAPENKSLTGCCFTIRIPDHDDH
ncbi:MAG TPA: hypothetical protein DHV36_17690 [Desulfobacteraceae bacterium]|nr:hypothetical protein [Desulfobacteraceae bacterium]